MRVLIEETCQLHRAGLRSLIEAMPGLEVVAEARDIGEAFELIALHRPELAVLELPTPSSIGLQAISRLSASYSETALVITASQGSLELARETLSRGARAFLGPDCGPSELELALQAAVQGHVFLSPNLSSQLLHGVLQRPRTRIDRDLSPRQQQILTRLADGQSSKQIAADLGLSVKTVETHRARMMESLGLRRASELLRYAVRHAGGRT